MQHLIRIFTVCKNILPIAIFSRGISKSYSQMYLKWTNQNLISFALSLSLVFLSLWNAHSFYRHANMMSPFESSISCWRDLIADSIPTGCSNLSWNTHEFAMAVTSFWRKSVQCTAQSLMYKHALSLLAQFITRGSWWSYIAHLTKQICIFTVEVSAKFTALGFLYKLHSTNHPHPPPPHPRPCFFTNLDNLNWFLKEGHQRNISAKLYWNWSSGLKSFI